MTSYRRKNILWALQYWLCCASIDLLEKKLVVFSCWINLKFFNFHKNKFVKLLHVKRQVTENSTEPKLSFRMKNNRRKGKAALLLRKDTLRRNLLLRVTRHLVDFDDQNKKNKISQFLDLVCGKVVWIRLQKKQVRDGPRMVGLAS